MRRSFLDKRRPLRRVLSMACAASLVYFVAFWVVGLIATALGYSKMPHLAFGYVFMASAYLMPFGLVDLCRGHLGSSL